MGVAAYGSLVPLEFVDLSIENALAAARTLVVSARPPARPVDWVANVLLAIPIGFCLLGALILGTRGTELAQVFVRSRFATSTDIVLGTIGTGAGVWLSYQWVDTLKHPDARAESPPDTNTERLPTANARKAIRRLVGSLVYGAALVALFCGPFDTVLDDPDLLGARLEGLFAIPFASTQAGSLFHVTSDVLRKLILFGGFASLLTITLAPLRPSPDIARLGRVVIVLVTTGLAGGIELLQVLLPPHVPDMTDVIIVGVSSACATIVTWQVVPHHLSANRAP